jgi:carboxymethylenebutenolidase
LTTAASRTTYTLTTADGEMDLYEAVPEGDPIGAVVVIQEAFGLNEHIRDVTRRFADEGYHAVAPALFHRAGGGTAPYGDFSKVMPLFDGFTDEGTLIDVDAAGAHLHAAGWSDDRIGIVGFCMGGRVSFLVALRRQLGAAVGFYGGGIVTARRRAMPTLIGEATELRTPWLGLFGDLDAAIPVEDVERLRATLEGAAVSTEIVRYADAEHGFHCDERESYNESAAKDAWTRTLDWLRRHLAR